MHARRRVGFSLVELMVVVGIAALLLGLLLPALSSARTRARKARELGDLRIVGHAWTMYANQSNDAILPGYLTTKVQQAWRVSYRYQDGSLIPPAPDYPVEEYPGGPPNVTGPWPWRLMPYMGYDENVVLGYQGDATADDRDPGERAWAIRSRPAFGYNSLFFGGWWASTRRPWYTPARTYSADGEPGPPLRVVAQSIGAVRRASEVLIFVSAAEREPGLYRYDAGRDDFDGTHTIVPPIITRYDVWGEPRAVREGDAPVGGGGPGAGSLAVSAGLNGVQDALHVYGADAWGGNPFEFG